MKISKRQRAQVVELLRCAADLGIVDNNPCPLTEAAHNLGLMRWTSAIDYERDEAVRLADRAIGETEWLDEPSGSWRGFGVRCLEAAARVEEGFWPAPRSKPHV